MNQVSRRLWIENQSEGEANMGLIQTMFNPKTIALIGASEKNGTVGRSILEYLQSSAKRTIYPVNPEREFILGIKSYPRHHQCP